jgi:membrane protein DedA with SNARE-associated domain
MSALVEQILSVPAWIVLMVSFWLPALESSAFLGFVIPGEAALLLGGVAASEGHVSPFAVAAFGIAGAIVGDAVGYAVGRRYGRRILDSTVGRIVKPHHLDRAQGALSARGGWAVFLGRFTVALRVMIPGLAGMAEMPYRRFALFNVVGGLMWGSVVVTAGFLAGHSWQRVGHLISGVGLAITVTVVLAFVVGVKVRARRAGMGALS